MRLLNPDSFERALVCLRVASRVGIGTQEDRIASFRRPRAMTRPWSVRNPLVSPPEGTPGSRDPDDPPVLADEMLEAGVAKTCFAQPLPAIGAGVTESVRSFDEPVEAQQQTCRIFAVTGARLSVAIMILLAGNLSIRETLVAHLARVDSARDFPRAANSADRRRPTSNRRRSRCAMLARASAAKWAVPNPYVCRCAWH